MRFKNVIISEGNKGLFKRFTMALKRRAFFPRNRGAFRFVAAQRTSHRWFFLGWGENPSWIRFLRACKRRKVSLGSYAWILQKERAAVMAFLFAVGPVLGV